jgi:hypothetical protein
MCMACPDENTLLEIKRQQDEFRRQLEDQQREAYTREVLERLGKKMRWPSPNSTTSK